MASQAFYENERRAFNRLCWLGHQEDNVRKVIAVLIAVRQCTGTDIVADVLISPEWRAHDVVARALHFAHEFETTCPPDPGYLPNDLVWTRLPEYIGHMYHRHLATACNEGILYPEPSLRGIPDGDTTLWVEFEGLPATKTELFTLFSRFGHVWRVTTRPESPTHAKVTFSHRSSMAAAIFGGEGVSVDTFGRLSVRHTINGKTVCVREFVPHH